MNTAKAATVVGSGRGQPRGRLGVVACVSVGLMILAVSLASHSRVRSGDSPGGDIAGRKGMTAKGSIAGDGVQYCAEAESIFARHPEERIPEVGLIAEGDIRDILENRKHLVSEDELIRALKVAARRRLAERISQALWNYREAGNNCAPATARELLPYLGGVGAEMLDRYRVLYLPGRELKGSDWERGVVEEVPGKNLGLGFFRVGLGSVQFYTLDGNGTGGSLGDGGHGSVNGIAGHADL